MFKKKTVDNFESGHSDDLYVYINGKPLCKVNQWSLPAEKFEVESKGWNKSQMTIQIIAINEYLRYMMETYGIK